ncbi:polysaccharide export outer membrane protein [Rhodobium orientis]|uniref:Sugar transporter n=1 Tax=Rhodobium orientis TaxID=34017 RepID=A0A327JQ16_9HYPH|nr:polysaccharide biosynthesis/export family protein [Rhodobium orientis]MBB4304798.1 polysaccharide export outer membrane protein [Rhodobium orientis]MBK5948028.1 sugar transporter [Rhodobium orientis]RAI27463.1 sugar transporter [Rhodobium orientis]
MTRVLRLILIAGLAALVVSCTGYRRPPTAFHQVLTEPYQLDSGDKLRLVVFGQSDISSTYTVDQAGHISVPLIGAVAARGKTTSDVERAIATKLRAGYIRNPDVSVEIEQYRPFFIMGEVRTPGQYPYVAGLTAQTAVAIAGGFSARGYQKSVDITRQINGKVLTGRVPITDPIRPGDTIYIRERLF